MFQKSAYSNIIYLENVDCSLIILLFILSLLIYAKLNKIVQTCK